MKSLIDSILRKEVQDFIHAHEHDDVQKLLLKQKTLFGVPTEWIANQISGRRKSQTRLSDWYKTGGIIYPHILNLEQSSSQATAQFKRNLVQETLLAGRPKSWGAFLALVALVGAYPLRTLFVAAGFDPHALHFL